MLTVSLANLAAFSLNFNGVSSFLASLSIACKTEATQSKFSPCWKMKLVQGRNYMRALSETNCS